MRMSFLYRVDAEKETLPEGVSSHHKIGIQDRPYNLPLVVFIFSYTDYKRSLGSLGHI